MQDSDEVVKYKLTDAEADLLGYQVTMFGIGVIILIVTGICYLVWV